MKPIVFKHDMSSGCLTSGFLCQATLDAIPQALVVLDTQGIILHVNRTCRDLLKLDDGELVTMPITTLTSGKATTSLKRRIAALPQQKKASTFSLTVASPRGKELRVTARMTPLIDEADNRPGAILVIHDTSEQTNSEHLEQELRDTNMRLSDALTQLRRTQQRTIEHERLNALGTMASGIAHDFNNSLVPVLGNADILIGHPELLDDREETLAMLKDIRTAAMDASNAVRRLREFYRMRGENEGGRADLNKQVTTALILTKPKWQTEMAVKGIHIKARTDFKMLTPVATKPSEIREVLINLILNAVDAMPEGGNLTLKTYEEQSRAVLEIIDTGTGMSEETQRRCFEPFYSTKGDAGTGLGLAMVYGFARSHNGTTEIDSEENKGTTIRIRLPFAHDLMPVARDAAERHSRLDQKLAVLVIDDEWSARKVVSKHLTLAGHTAETASSGLTGIDTFRVGNFDAVITDRAMADMSGDQVAVAIKKIDASMPIILLTGFGDILKEEATCPPGIDLILSKPVTQEEVLNALATVMTITRT